MPTGCSPAAAEWQRPVYQWEARLAQDRASAFSDPEMPLDQSQPNGAAA
jgi:hypothetical protein